MTLSCLAPLTLMPAARTSFVTLAALLIASRAVASASVLHVRGSGTGKEVQLANAERASLSDEVEGLARGSESVVHARIVDVRTYQATETSEAHADVTLEVIETLRGASDRKVVVSVPVERTGKSDEPTGSADEEALAAPSVAPGRVVVAFLARKADGMLTLTGGRDRGLSRVEGAPSGDSILLRGGAADGLALADLAASLGGGRTIGGAPTSVPLGSRVPSGTPRASGSGIEGEAMIGPTRPSHRIGGPPDVAPYQTTLVIVAAASKTEMARVTTGPDGRFRVSVPAGEYVVMPAESGELRLPRAEPLPVKVLPGHFAHVTVNFDNGMR